MLSRYDQIYSESLNNYRLHCNFGVSLISEAFAYRLNSTASQNIKEHLLSHVYELHNDNLIEKSMTNRDVFGLSENSTNPNAFVVQFDMFLIPNELSKEESELRFGSKDFQFSKVFLLLLLPTQPFQSKLKKAIHNYLVKTETSYKDISIEWIENTSKFSLDNDGEVRIVVTLDPDDVRITNDLINAMVSTGI